LFTELMGGESEPAMEPGAAGTLFTVTARQEAALLPQLLEAVTQTFPDDEPKVTVMAVVP
jgi:hypothetical protein